MRKPFVVHLSFMLMAALALVACGGGSGGGGGKKKSIKPVTLINGQPAAVVVGQPDMTSGLPNQGGSASEYTIQNAWGNPAVANGRLYLPDFNNHRVLGYNSIPAVNNAPADFVLGQPDFTTTTSGTTQGTFYYPENVASDRGKLFVVDNYNSRVLVWNTLPTATGALPDVVVGQADFTSAATACNASTLAAPEGVYAVAGKLIVPDEDNNRVLIWNTVPSTNGAPADIVLGQADFTSCASNRGGPVSRTSMYNPQGAWSDGKRLMVLDSENNRVLIWNTFPTVNDTAPDVVVGQPNFISSSPDTTQDRFFWPVDISSNGKQLFVADNQNNRVLVWNSIPTVNNAPADVVLGQPDFTSNTFGTDENSFHDPGGVLVYGNQLIVGEYGNSRYLIFNGL